MSPVTTIDLFSGAGGFSAGLQEASDRLGRTLELYAVNHWDVAIDSHQVNHPDADHRCAKVENLEPRHVVGSDDVELITGGFQCTHYSSARGGKPVDEQERASPWHLLDWVTKLRPSTVIVENVKEFEDWGPVVDGQPTRSGEYFASWVDAFEGLGYDVDWRTLVAADYGDPTSRERLFVVARRDEPVTWPEPTHEDNWRTASEIIDWSNRGSSIWTRKTPLVNNTMERIAEGIRRFTSDDLAPYADVVEELGKAEVSQLQEVAVDIADARDVCDIADEPFLVHGPARAHDDEPVCGLALPYILGQHSGSIPRNIYERPTPTVAARGAIQLVEPVPIKLDETEPFLIEYYGNGGARSVDEPLPTVTTRDRFALIVPECYPWGLDLRYRLLEPHELAAAQGFPPDYEFEGTKGEIKKQIGNAVPVGLATELCGNLLDDGDEFAPAGQVVETDD